MTIACKISCSPYVNAAIDKKVWNNRFLKEYVAPTDADLSTALLTFSLSHIPRAQTQHAQSSQMSTHTDKGNTNQTKPDECVCWCLSVQRELAFKVCQSRTFEYLQGRWHWTWGFADLLLKASLEIPPAYAYPARSPCPAFCLLHPEPNTAAYSGQPDREK